jgi:hypothetical protein
VNLYESGSPKLVSVLKQHLSADSTVLVDIHLRDGVDRAQVIRVLELEGFRLTAASVLDPNRLEGYLPLYAARSAAWAGGIKTIQAVQRPFKFAGSVQSQAVAFEKADRAHARGITGKGIKVGALSDSYDACPPTDCTIHAADDIASGDLPPDVVVLEEITPANGPGIDEGRGMLQLVYDLARSSGLHRRSTER